MNNSNLVYELNDYNISFKYLHDASSGVYYQFQFPFKSALTQFTDKCTYVQIYIYIYI